MYTTEFHSDIKKVESQDMWKIVGFGKYNIQSGDSNSETQKHCVLSHMWMWMIPCNVYLCTHVHTYICMRGERGKDIGGGGQVGLRPTKGRGDEERKSTKIHLENIITIANALDTNFFKLL